MKTYVDSIKNLIKTHERLTNFVFLDKQKDRSEIMTPVRR